VARKLLVVVASMPIWLELYPEPPLAIDATPGSFVSWNACGRLGSLDVRRVVIAAV
jgi:hypothetical protein